MKRMRKLCAVVAAVMSIAAITSCGSQTQNTDGQGSAGEKTTLRVEIFERGDVPAGAGTITDNALTKWIQENFGDPNNIQMEYVPVPRAQELQQLNVLMAAGEAPDIVFTYDYPTAYNFYTQGGLTDLTGYLDNLPRLKEFLGEEVLEYGRLDGKQVLLPAKRLITGRISQMIRQDWLDKLGLEAPTTTDELYQVLKAFKEQDPGGLGDKTIPWALPSIYSAMEDFLNCFVEYDTLSEAEANAVPAYGLPGYKEGLRFLNKLYNEGLISKDFALDKDSKQYTADLASGRVGFINEDLGRCLQIGGAYSTMQKNVPGATFTAVDTFTDANGNHPKLVYPPVGLFIMIPKSSENVEAALKYLDWMAQPDVLRRLQFGEEGVNYTLDEEGFPVTIDSEEAQKTHWYNLGFDTALIVNGKYAEDINKAVRMQAIATDGHADLYEACYENCTREGKPTIIMPSNEATIKYQATATEKALEMVTKSIMAAPEQFDATFDALQQEYLKIGGEAIREANIKQYEELYLK